MRRIAAVCALAASFSLSALAAKWTGYIEDEKCTTGKGPKAVATEAHAGCAATCIKGGSAAVLVTADGKVYKIADQGKVTEHAGQKVTVTGKMEGDSIRVDKVTM